MTKEHEIESVITAIKIIVQAGKSACDHPVTSKKTKVDLEPNCTQWKI